MKNILNILIFLVFNTISYTHVNALGSDRNLFDAIKMDTLFVKSESEKIKSTSFYFSNYYQISNMTIAPSDTNKNVVIEDGVIEWYCSNKPGIHKINLSLIINNKDTRLVRLERNVIDINKLDTNEIINRFNTAVSLLDKWIIDKTPLANVYNGIEHCAWSDGNDNSSDTMIRVNYDNYIRQDEVIKSLNFLESLTEIESTINLRTHYQRTIDCLKECRLANADIDTPFMGDPCEGCNLTAGAGYCLAPMNDYQIHYTNPDVYPILKLHWIKWFEQNYRIESTTEQLMR